MTRLTFASTLALLLMYGLGIAIGVTAGISPNPSGILLFVVQVAIKYAAVCLVFGILAWCMSHVLFQTSVRSLIASMHDKVRNQENISPAVVLGGLFLVVGQMISLTYAATFQVYLYNVLTKGSFGLLLGLVATSLMARYVGVKSEKQFTDLFRKSENNQVVIFLMIALNVAMLVAMT